MKKILNYLREECDQHHSLGIDQVSVVSKQINTNTKVDNTIIINISSYLQIHILYSREISFEKYFSQYFYQFAYKQIINWNTELFERLS